MSPGMTGFFDGLGVVPLQDPDAAAALLAEVWAPKTVAAYARRLSFDPLLFDAGLLTALVDVVAPTL